ncbi:g11837 [Coccomyxa elongata]
MCPFAGVSTEERLATPDADCLTLVSAITGATVGGLAVAAATANPQHGIEGLPDAEAQVGGDVEMAGHQVGQQVGVAQNEEGIPDGQPYQNVMEEEEGASRP